jgi:MoaA/NifB/PqqE/SkfB family radical SAM enzyme
MKMLPERLNLSIGNRCWVSCPGCYNYFGAHAPALERTAASVREFITLGIERVTVSGGDPLRIEGIRDFLAHLRRLGVQSIKLDTVGIGLLSGPGQESRLRLEEVLPEVDILGLPLDGWSNASVSLFRYGRPRLYDETRRLLAFLSTYNTDCLIYVNTVLHRGNLDGLIQIFRALLRHSCVSHWNVFEYTPTDQVSEAINLRFRIAEREFLRARDRILTAANDGKPPFEIEFASVRERLGRYLLINSDGESWLPDEMGRSIRLGSVYGRELDVLQLWRDVAIGLQSETPRGMLGE